MNENTYQIVDETSDLLALYSFEKPSLEQVQDFLLKHYKIFGRIGFNSELDSTTVEYFYRHFANNSRDYLSSELNFIKETLVSENLEVFSRGFKRAKSFLPVQKYQALKVVLLLNGRRTDAKVLGSRQFGINLQNLFSKVVSKDNSNYDLAKAKSELYNIAAHEGSHLFLNQIEPSDKTKVFWAFDVAFGEGLAVLSEEGFGYPWSADYLEEASTYISLVCDMENAKESAEMKALVEKLCSLSSLQKHKPEYIEAALNELEKEGVLSKKEFNELGRELLVRKNGPLYYAGYYIWNKILEEEGIERVKEVVQSGPNKFAIYFLNENKRN